MSEASDYNYVDADEDKALRCVLDIVCISDTNERNNKYQKMNKEYEAIKIQAEKHIKEIPDEVKETLTTFTKIAQRIKDCREKLGNLKKRLKICRTAFTGSYEKAETTAINFLKSKECVSLITKIAKVMDSPRRINLCINEKKFYEAASLISETQYYLTHDLANIETVVNSRMDFDYIMSHLHKSIILELVGVLFDEHPLRLLSHDSNHFYNQLPTLPSPNNMNIFDSIATSHEEKIESLVKSLKNIHKLKIGLAQIIKSINYELDKVMDDVSLKLRSDLLETMAISRTQESVLRVNKKVACTLVLRILDRLNIIYEKFYHIVSLFDTEFRNYEVGWAEHIDESLPEATVEALKYNINQGINYTARFLVKSYLTEEISEQLDMSSCASVSGNNTPSLTASALQHVFSLKYRLFEVPRKENIFKFDEFTPTNKSQNEFNCRPGGATISLVCQPSIKYFKYFFIPLHSYVLIHNEFYIKNPQIQNPLREFINSYFKTHFTYYSFKRIESLFNVNYTDAAEKYGEMTEIHFRQLEKRRSLFKISFDFAKVVKYTIGCITLFPLHATHFVEYYRKIYQNLMLSFNCTLKNLTVTNAITLMCSQVMSNFSSEKLIQLRYTFENKVKFSSSPSPTFGYTKLLSPDTQFVDNIEYSLVLSLENIVLIGEHVMSHKTLVIALNLLENANWLTSITSDFMNYLYSITPESPFNYTCKNVILRRRHLIDIPSIMRSFMDEFVSDDTDDLVASVNSDVDDFAMRLFALVYFETRFHVAFFLQSLFTIDDGDGGCGVNSNVHRLYSYVVELYTVLPSLTSRKFGQFIFVGLPQFLHHYCLGWIKKETRVKQIAPYVRNCLFVLVSQFTSIPDIDTGVMMETVYLFDLLQMSVDELVKNVVDHSPRYSFETYSIIINAIIVDESIAPETLNLRLKEIKHCFSN